MKLEDQENSLLNKPTLSFPPAQKKNERVPEVVTDAPKKKQKIFSFWGVATILGIFGGLLTLPSLVSCNPVKTKQMEAKVSVSAMNRAQEANFLERKAFVNSVEGTGTGIKNQTDNYNYSIQKTKAASFQYGVSRKQNLKSYVGGVFVVPATTANKSEIATVSILCEGLKPGSTTLTPPTLVKNIPSCSAGTKDLIKR